MESIKRQDVLRSFKDIICCLLAMLGMDILIYKMWIMSMQKNLQEYHQDVIPVKMMF